MYIIGELKFKTFFYSTVRQKTPQYKRIYNQNVTLILTEYKQKEPNIKIWKKYPVK